MLRFGDIRQSGGVEFVFLGNWRRRFVHRVDVQSDRFHFSGFLFILFLERRVQSGALTLEKKNGKRRQMSNLCLKFALTFNCGDADPASSVTLLRMTITLFRALD